jgi:alkylation response protein AidB-like acyl-CoA dehydrogenase
VSNGFDAYRLAPGGRLQRWDASAVSARAVAGLSLGMADVTVAGPPADTVDIDAAALAHVHEVAGLFQAAALVGLAAEALAQTVDYVQQREQFGGPIGRFQAVKHLIADVYARNEAASSSVLFAAAALEARDMDAADQRYAVSCARVLGLRAGLGASKTMAQLFGGIGYTWEVDVHWFLKTTLDACARFGGIDAAARAVGEQLVASSC